MKSHFEIAPLLFCLFFAGSLPAQTYTFSTYQADYVSVGVGFPLTEDVWDNPSFVVPLNYQFALFDDLIQDIELIDSFSTGGVMASILDGSIASVFHVFGPDIIDRGYYLGESASAIYFAYFGTPGQRVFIQEWLNVGFAHGDTANGVFTDYINFQLQLHEASREIIFHFGSSSITNPLADYEGLPGPSVGLIKEIDITGVGLPQETFLLTGNPANPSIHTAFEPTYLNGSIPENSVYRFKQAGTSTDKVVSGLEKPIFYPNPSSGEFYIQQDVIDKIKFPIRMISAHGAVVKEIGDAGQMTVEGLAPGIYELRCQTEHGWHAERMVVLD
jgi:hypothetical protein